jgi:hypothetical protein
MEAPRSGQAGFLNFKNRQMFLAHPVLLATDILFTVSSPHSDCLMN